MKTIKSLALLLALLMIFSVVFTGCAKADEPEKDVDIADEEQFEEDFENVAFYRYWWPFSSYYSKSTQKETQKATEKATQKVTQAATQPATQKPTQSTTQKATTPPKSGASVESVMTYSGKAYSVVYNNRPDFSSSELTTNAYEFYLDNENPSIIFSEKFYGQNVRPVSGEITRVTGIEPVQKSISMNVSDKLFLEYNIYPESLRDLANVTLHSEDESVVQVSGLYLTAVGEGECRVQIKCNGLTDYCDVTVVDDTEPLSIALNVTELSLDPGESFQLEATITPASAAEGAVINWSTTNDVQGYVDDNGFVTAFLWDSRAPALIIAEYNGVNVPNSV